MSAYNARLQPKEIFGLPLYAVGAVTVLLPMIALAVLVPVFLLKLLFGMLALASLVAAVFFLVVGNELPFLRLVWLARHEDRSVTAETWTLN